MKAPDQVLRLIDTFDRNLDAYRAGSYNEAQLRQEFLNPFFAALGWDVDNTSGYAEPYKDVIHEDSIKIGAATKAPDYCFRIGGARKFFVEAKKPSVDIKHDVHPAYQLRRYAWSAKLPLSVLTDFEEFAVYDCRVKPAKNDKAGKARIMYVPYADYASRHDIETLRRVWTFRGPLPQALSPLSLQTTTSRRDETWSRTHASPNPALTEPDCEPSARPGHTSRR